MKCPLKKSRSALYQKYIYAATPRLTLVMATRSEFMSKVCKHFVKHLKTLTCTRVQLAVRNYYPRPGLTPGRRFGDNISTRLNNYGKAIYPLLSMYYMVINYVYVCFVQILMNVCHYHVALILQITASISKVPTNARYVRGDIFVTKENVSVRAPKCCQNQLMLPCRLLGKHGGLHAKGGSGLRGVPGTYISWALA